MKKISIFGDVHNKYDQLFSKINKIGPTKVIQVGDMGFDYGPLKKYPPSFLWFIGGNHDNYDKYFRLPNSLDDFGTMELDFLKFFYIRGAYSIDVEWRLENQRVTQQKTWWSQEQLHADLRRQAYELYKNERPKIMITHSCPLEIAKLIGNPRVLESFRHNPKTFTTHTQELLQQCFEEHKPDLHIFGHFHQNLDFCYKGTRFICLDELSYININEDGSIENKNKNEQLHKNLEVPRFTV